MDFRSEGVNLSFVSWPPRLPWSPPCNFLKSEKSLSGEFFEVLKIDEFFKFLQKGQKGLKRSKSRRKKEGVNAASKMATFGPNGPKRSKS